MTKLPVVKPKRVIRALERYGFAVHHTSGSHYILKKEKLRVTVPFHNEGLEAANARFDYRAGRHDG
jgi:predicted RNA binding protein YcfA (HicA-like mRNA interferase family)